MSPVHDAHRHQGGTALPRGSWWARQPSRRKAGVLLVASAVLAGTLPPHAAAAGEPGPTQAIAANAAKPTETSKPATARVAETGPLPPRQRFQPINISVQQRAAVGQGAADADGTIAHAVRTIEEAIAAGDVPRARAALGRLEALLPTGSLTLLRMRAWVAHCGQDMAAAEQLYRRVLERVPDDLNAGVNIALLDARRGDVADARKRLMRLSGQHTRSPLVARALAELDAPQ